MRYPRISDLLSGYTFLNVFGLHSRTLHVIFHDLLTVGNYQILISTQKRHTRILFPVCLRQSIYFADISFSRISYTLDTSVLNIFTSYNHFIYLHNDTGMPEYICYFYLFCKSNSLYY